MKTFDEIFIDKTKYGVKIQTSEYGEQGKHIIIDQGQSQIAGYTDCEDGLFEEVPVVIFGDHTRVIKYVDEPFFLGADGVKVLRSKDNNANYKYLYYALKNAKIPNTGYNRHFKWLKEVKIKYPDRERQDEIVEFLDKASDVIQKRQDELSKLDDLIKARFVEMFGNKGENPNGYEEDTLGNLYKFQYGKGNNIPEDKGEYPCYGSNGIVGHHTEYNNEDSPIIGHIGAYAGIVNWGAGKHYVTYNGVMCKLKTDRVNPIYGFHLLQQQDFNRVATKGGGQPFVSYGDLEAPIVVVPPIEVQEAYAAFAEQVNKSKVVVQKALDETQLLFNSLMQKYFG